MPSNFRGDINGLRAIAVISVMLFHFKVAFIGGGFVGVDVFFVISGFLMTSIIVKRLEAGKFSVLNFYWDRATRIIPALLGVIIVLLVVGFLLIDPMAYEVLAKHAASSLLFLSNIKYWSESGYFDAQSAKKWLLHTWSLSVEWQFYIVYPLFLMVLFRISASKWLRLGVVSAALIGSLGLAAWLGQSSSGKLVSFGYFMLPSRAYELLAGGVLLFLPDLVQLKRGWLGAAFGYLGLGLIMLSVFVFSKTSPWPSYNAVLPVAGTALIIFANKPNLILDNPLFQYVGKISYSLYLWHWPVFVGFNYFVGDTPFGANSAWLVPVIEIIASVALADLSYRTVETLSQRYLRSGSNPFYRGVGAGAVFLVGVAVCGFVVASHGIPLRIKGDRALYADAVLASTDRTYPMTRCGGVSNGVLRVCELGVSSPGKDTLIIGDSFAEMWWPRAVQLKSAMTDHSVVFATKGGCPALPLVNRTDPGYDCVEFYNKAVELAQTGRFSNVVFVGQWAGYFRKGRHVVEVRTGQGWKQDLTDADVRSVVDALHADILKIEKNGARVTVLQTSPFPGSDAPDMLRTEIFKGSAPQSAFIDWPKYELGSLSIDADLASLASSGINVIDTGKAICAASGCAYIANGRSLYADGVHIRAAVTKEKGAFLDPYFLGRTPAVSLK